MAWKLLQEKVAVCEKLNDRQGLASAQEGQAMVLMQRGEADAALPLLQQVASDSREIGDKARLASSVGNIATIFLERRQYDEALASLAEQERLAGEMQDVAALARSRFNRALVLKAQGQLEHATDLLAEVEQLCRQINNPMGLALALLRRPNDDPATGSPSRWPPQGARGRRDRHSVRLCAAGPSDGAAGPGPAPPALMGACGTGMVGKGASREGFQCRGTQERDRLCVPVLRDAGLSEGAGCRVCGIPRPSTEASGGYFIRMLVPVLIAGAILGWLAGYPLHSRILQAVLALVGIIAGFLLMRWYLGREEVRQRTFALLRITPEAWDWQASEIAAEIGTRWIGYVERHLSRHSGSAGRAGGKQEACPRIEGVTRREQEEVEPTQPQRLSDSGSRSDDGWGTGRSAV